MYFETVGTYMALTYVTSRSFGEFYSLFFLLTLLVVGHLAYRSNDFMRTSMPSKTVWNMNYFW